MGIKSGNGKEACSTLKVLTKTDKQKSAVVEDSARKILTECTAVRNRWTESCSVLYNHELLQTLAYSRVAGPPYKRLKACLS